MVLRDGRKVYGILRSYDQFGNMVLDDTIERLYLDLEFAEDHLGTFLVRGENIVLVGELVSPESHHILLILSLFIQKDEEEFKSVSRRMSRFKRPFEALFPRYQAARRKIQEEHLLSHELGATDMTEFDFY